MPGTKSHPTILRYQRARQRAYMALEKIHPDEYRVLFAAERLKQGLPPKVEDSAVLDAIAQKVGAS